MIAYLQGISQQRSFWKLLLVSALFLELSAMVFQHGLGLSPCVMCIYERITTMGLITAALVTTRFMGSLVFCGLCRLCRTTVVISRLGASPMVGADLCAISDDLAADPDR